MAPQLGGIVENIQHCSNGFLFTPGDRFDFSAKLKTLIENPTLKKEMGARARISVREYSWERSIQNLVDIWHELKERCKAKRTTNSELRIPNSELNPQKTDAPVH